ncbi:MAG: hypothetical protein R3C61_05580 [Bacteroidia bacterium]
MSRKLRRLFPAFLHNLDKYLLLNHPEIWSTRVHYLLWGILLTALIAVGFAWVQVDIRNLSNPTDWFFWMFIPVAIISGIWIYDLSKFNPTWAFGDFSVKSNLSAQVAVFAGVIGLVLLPYILGSSVLRFNASRISDSELVNDINKLNLVYFNLAYEPATHPRDIHRNEEEMPPVFGPDYLRDYVTGTDIFFDWKKFSREEKLEMVSEYLRIVEKYSGWESILVYEPEQILDHEVENEDFFREAFQSSLNSMRTPLERIAMIKEQQHRHSLFFMDKEFGNILFLVLTVFWITILVYRNIGWKKLVLTVITGLVLWGTTLFFSDILRLGSIRIGGLLTGWAFTLLFWIVFVVQAYFYSPHKRINNWKIVFLSLGVMMTPWIPLVILEYAGIRPSVQTALVAAVFSFAVWNAVFLQRFQFLLSAPHQN